MPWKFAVVLALLWTHAATAETPLVRSERSGNWSDAKTWAGEQVLGAGPVQIRAGHHVRYDLESDQVIRSVHVAGTLEFVRDRNTRLDVGLIKIQAGEDSSENGFDCDAHMPRHAADQPKPALLVGLPDELIPAGKTALIRLVHLEGMDPETCPAIVCCGGRMEFHGSPLKQTWTKLAREAYRNEPIVLLKRRSDRRLEARRSSHSDRHDPPVRLQARPEPPASPSVPRPRSGTSKP